MTATAVAGAAYEVKLNGVVDQDGVVGLVVGSGNVIVVVVTCGAGDCGGDGAGNVQTYGDGDAGRVFGGEFEWAFAHGGWWGGRSAGACLRVGDDGLHGGS